MYTQRKIHSGFVGSLFLLATLLLFFFHTLPAQRDLAGLAEKIEGLRKELVSLEEKEPGGAAEAKISEVEQMELVKQIPQTLEQDIIITDLNKTAKNASVSFNALTFALQQNEALPTVNISAGFQGASANIIRFLKQLEANPRKFRVKNAGISRSETEGGLEFINLNITFQAFYQTDA